MPLGAAADTAADVTALRQEMDAMRAAYEARLQALEQRLQQRRGRARRACRSCAAVAAAAPARRAGPPQRSLPSPVPRLPLRRDPVAATDSTRRPAAPNAFNPAISLILSGLYTRTSQDPANYAITGFPLPPGAEIGPGTRGFSLAESELGFAASIDPWLRGAANIAIAADNSVSVEEAFVQTTSLGNGLSLKAGRFFSGIGYLNPQHAHTWDFVDNPLAYQAMLGTQYGDDGVQLTLARADRPVPRARRRGRPRPQLSRQRHRAATAPAWSRSRRTPAATSATATAGAPACRC